MNDTASLASSSSWPSSSSSSPICGIGEFMVMKRRLAGSVSIPSVISDVNHPRRRAFARRPLRARCNANSRVELTTAPLLAQ